MPTSTWNRRLLAVLRIVALGVAIAPKIAAAQTAEASADAGEQLTGTAGEAAEDAPQPFVLPLGDFHLRDWRPTRNETPDLRFAVAIVFNADTPVLTRERLAHWVNRLRDQTIIAMRLAETKDFAEPSLQQVQRLIRVRVSRILPRLAVDEVLITDFALGDN
ncbi:MAG: hypothetical protein CMJ58_26640 [Planctomycetaceae bacterium]|nr:hypothetical protein [Planctomycetaceae bacterium]